jgi:hypothetical protein
MNASTAESCSLWVVHQGLALTSAGYVRLERVVTVAGWERHSWDWSIARRVQAVQDVMCD